MLSAARRARGHPRETGHPSCEVRSVATRTLGGIMRARDAEAAKEVLRTSAQPLSAPEITGDRTPTRAYPYSGQHSSGEHECAPVCRRERRHHGTGVSAGPFARAQRFGEVEVRGRKLGTMPLGCICSDDIEVSEYQIDQASSSLGARPIRGAPKSRTTAHYVRRRLIRSSASSRVALRRPADRGVGGSANA